MIRIWTIHFRASYGKPRASGDDPVADLQWALPLGVNPARAGMIRICDDAGRAAAGKPRASGDDPVAGWKTAAAKT